MSECRILRTDIGQIDYQSGKAPKYPVGGCLPTSDYYNLN